MKSRHCLVLMALLGLSGCAQKKVTLPQEGRVTVYDMKKGAAVKEGSHKLKGFKLQSPLMIKSNFNGLASQQENMRYEKKCNEMRIDAGAGNFVVVEGVLYFYESGKLQRLDLVKNVRMEALDLTIDRPDQVHQTFITANDQYIALCTSRGDVRVFDSSSQKMVFEHYIKEFIYKLPLVHGKHLYIQTASDKLYKFDLEQQREKSEIWVYEHTKQELVTLQNSTMSQPVIWKNFVITGMNNGDMIMLDQETRETQWVFPSETSKANAPTMPIIEGDAMYITGSGTGVYRLDLNEQGRVWRTRIADVLKTPLSVGDYLFVVTKKSLVAVDKKTGDIVYSKEGYSAPATPILLNGKLIIVDAQGVHAVNPVDGKRISFVEAKDRQVPILVGSVLSRIIISYPKQVLIS